MVFVFDTNVLISAAMSRGFCRTAFDTGCAKGQLARSDDTFAELVRTLEKPRLQKLLRQADKVDFLANFLTLTKSFPVAEKIMASRDVKDNMFLELAVSCQAEAIVTRDGDLLTLNPFRGIPIITVAVFLNRYS